MYRRTKAKLPDVFDVKTYIIYPGPNVALASPTIKSAETISYFTIYMFEMSSWITVTFTTLSLLITLHTRISASTSESQTLVTTVGGIVRGSILKTRQNDEILAFHGVRYAEPPVEKNRFRPPIPVKPWSGVYNANLENVACHQPTPHSSYILSEDCLLLDVYTKNLNGSLPVIVFIHGGGFSFGAKSDIGPEYLLERDVILVSINYRLHALGFLSTGTDEAPGNYGFKDQVLALKWVRDNIRVFGGNPNLVTLNGHSAGSSSVTLHLVSPMSRGLFQRAIVMSGSSMSHLKSASMRNSRVLLERTSCNNENITTAVECLRRLPVENISNNALIVNDCIMDLWNYVVEPESLSEEKFLIEDPTASLVEGDFLDVPIMAGITADEFSYLANVLTKTTTLEEFNRNFSHFAPQCFGFDDYPAKEHITESFKKIYFKNEPLAEDIFKQLENMYADGVIGFGMYRFVSLASLYRSIFFYRFDYVGRFSHFYNPDGLPLGASHGDELQYMYVFRKIAPIISKNDPENFIIEKMISWWAEFARTGNPNNPNDKYTKDIVWLPTSRNDFKTLQINTTCSFGGIPNYDRYTQWDHIFPLPEGGKKSVFHKNIEAY